MGTVTPKYSTSWESKQSNQQKFPIPFWDTSSWATWVSATSNNVSVRRRYSLHGPTSVAVDKCFKFIKLSLFIICYSPKCDSDMSNAVSMHTGQRKWAITVIHYSCHSTVSLLLNCCLLNSDIFLFHVYLRMMLLMPLNLFALADCC